MKIVIDTNIIIAGADDENSHAYKIIQEVIAGRIEAFATHQTMSENRQMLRKLVRDREYKIFLEDFFSKLQIVKIYQHLNIVSDPEDNKLIESCVASGANYLITNDREVLDVDEYHGAKIITAQEFWGIYKKADGDDSWSDWTKMMMGS